MRRRGTRCKSYKKGLTSSPRVCISPRCPLNDLLTFWAGGKKTFGTLFSKVKAKIQEFDQPAGQSSSGYGAGGDTYPYDANQHPYPTARNEQQAQAQAQAQMPAYYDPNERATNTTPPSSATAAGYDAAPPASMTASGAPISPPTTNTGAPQIDGG